MVYRRRLVAQQAASTLSATAFCREEQINLQQFYRWRRRFRADQLSGSLFRRLRFEAKISAIFLP
ncbi:MAG: IS66 family insertion sequence element accessory protein TnpA [Syntrophobacteria bacterium]